MPNHRKLILLIIMLIIVLVTCSCGSQRLSRRADVTNLYVFYPEDSVSFHRIDSMATIKRENTQLKKENKRLRLAILVTAGLGWGFTILKLVD